MSDPSLASLDGQGWIQVGELLLAFALSSLIGLERQLRHKPAGLRTQALVGTTAALLLLLSKYGFTDVLVANHIVLDPSRVAAQVVSGVGFLGAGLILTRRGAVRGLTTAAAVWEVAAIGMAAGAGLWLLALIVTLLHFIVTYLYTFVTHRIPGTQDTVVQLEFAYKEGQGVLRNVLSQVTQAQWTIRRLSVDDPTNSTDEQLINVSIAISGSAAPDDLVHLVAAAPGVTSVSFVTQEDLD
jgi:putative Mg2+ transporter-C (MgtC) family protein